MTKRKRWTEKKKAGGEGERGAEGQKKKSNTKTTGEGERGAEGQKKKGNNNNR